MMAGDYWHGRAEEGDGGGRGGRSRRNCSLTWREMEDVMNGLNLGSRMMADGYWLK